MGNHIPAGDDPTPGAALASDISAAIQRHGPALEPGGLIGVLTAALACAIADDFWPELPSDTALTEAGRLLAYGVLERRHMLAKQNVCAEGGRA